MASWLEGDIYFWSWNAATMERHRKSQWGGMDPNHCCSHKAIIDSRGRLLDTYWHGGSDSSRTWTQEAAQSQLDLTYIGNLGALVKISYWELDYYEPGDVVDMRHLNNSSGLTFHKPGAVRSRERMLDVVRQRRKEARSQMDSAIYTLERCAVLEAHLRSPNVDLYEVYL